MTGKTHLSFGIATALLLYTDVVSSMALLVGSILPDIDNRNSLLGKALPFVPKLIKHRTLTHSLIFLAICYFINFYLFIGCTLHVFLDMLTKSGCQLFYPINLDIRLPFAKYIRTGGKFENILFGLSLLLMGIFAIL